MKSETALELAASDLFTLPGTNVRNGTHLSTLEHVLTVVVGVAWTGVTGRVVETKLVLAELRVASGGWNVELLLDSIIEAAHQGRCNALIDTGALITGLTNQEVGEPSQDATYSRSAREGCRVGFGEEGFNMEKHHETR